MVFCGKLVVVRDDAEVTCSFNTCGWKILWFIILDCLYSECTGMVLMGNITMGFLTLAEAIFGICSPFCVPYGTV